MIKDIKYNGFSVEPSDYECPDGTLATSTNLVCEDSQIKPVFTPKVLMRFIDNGRLVLIHHVPNKVNYIIQRGNALYWMTQPEHFGGDVTDASAVLIKDYGTINDLAIVGNTIAIASTDMEYILWKDNNYKVLGSKPPFISIEFGCQKIYTLSDSEELHLDYRSVRDQPMPALGEETSNAVYGLMLPAITEKITSKGYFYMPFFVRYAYRLYDGSYNWHSAPILMLPSVIIPVIKATKGNVKDGKLPVTTTLDIPYFELKYKIPDIGSLADWKDIISGIDIFLTPQIYTYNQSARIEYLSSTRSQLLSGYYDYNPNNYDPRGGQVGIPDNIFEGHYAEYGNAQYTDHVKSTADSVSKTCWRVMPNENFHDQIKSCMEGRFFKAAAIDIDSLDLITEFKGLPLSSSDLSNLNNRETLPDEYQSHHVIIANTALSYNSRLCITDLAISAPKPFSLSSSVDSNSSNSTYMVEIEVYTRLNGVISHAINDDLQMWDMEGHFPRYIYYPDSSAYKMNFKYAGQDHFVDLVPHDFLNGAYYYGSLAENGKPTAFAAAETHAPATSIDLGNKVYVSEINNPFVFPAQNIVTVGNGSVKGLASAAKALSQGQFGQFPLYAFTTEGVWALEVSSTGTFSARQPISRDVCLDAKSITPIDSSVLFATKRGIMQISGSQTTCISDIIKSETPFDVLSLPHLQDLHRTIPGHPQDNCIPTLPFTQFLQGCGMVYDYIAQRIIVYNPQRDYAYIYSLKSQQWGMMLSQLAFGVPSYPDAFAIQSISHVPYNFLVDLDKTDEEVSHGILITRPIKLLGEGVNGDMLKTINTVIQRGNFSRGHVQTVLYGSRDLKNWFVVWSSKDHYLRGFRGTPYKYFRIACVTSLAPDESIFGASIEFEPRLTNHLR